MSKHIFRIGETEHGQAVKIDLETFVGTRGVFIANSGGGKSYALRTIIEQTAKHVQWIMIDPEGEYASLRQMFPEMLLVAKDGELPVDVRSAKLLARKIMENRLSTIVDLYSLLEIRAAWTAEFVSALINLPRDLWSPVIVAIDEAHRLAPETPTGNREEREQLNRSRRAVIMLADSGRKQARGTIIASQRVSKLAADARAELRNRFIGLTVQDLDRDRAADDLGFTKAQARGLRDLNAGEFYAYGPALNTKGIVKIKFDLPQTKHPKPGSQRLTSVPPASEALKMIVKQIGDLPQEAQQEANDLATAQKRIWQLERDLKARPVQMQPAAPQVQIERIEVPVITDEQIQRLEDALKLIKAVDESLQTNAGSLGKELMNAYQSVSASIRTRHLTHAPVTQRPPAPQVMNAAPTHTLPRRQTATTREGKETPALGKGERIVLSAVAQYPDGIQRDQLSVLTGYKRSSRDAYLQRLRAGGLIEDGPTIRVTVDGVAALGDDYQPLPTGRALQDYWMSRLPEGERRVLTVAIQDYPRAVKRELIDEITGYKRSSRDAYISRLQARRLLRQGPGAIVASDTLFE